MPVDKKKISALVERINSLPDKGEEFRRRYLAERRPELKERGRISSTPVKVPVMWGNASSAATSSKDIPRVDSTVGNEMRYVAALTAPLWAGYVPNAIGFLSNPASAATDIGAKMSTALDAYGLASGLRNLGDDANKALKGEFTVNDIPRILLDASVLIPGASQFTNPSNIGLLENAARNIGNIRNITSRETLLNRLAHPIETYRFSDLTRRAKSVLPDDVHSQLMEDMRKLTLHNGLPGTKPYNGFNRRAFANEIAYSGGWNQNIRDWNPEMIGGLADPNANNMFSRAHELGHAAEVAGRKRGYIRGIYPPVDYNYGKANILNSNSPERIGEEYFADAFANKITGDMMLDVIPNISIERYDKVKNVFPELVSHPTRKK